MADTNEKCMVKKTYEFVMIDSVKRLGIASDVTYKLFRAFALSVMSDLDCLITSGEKDKGIGRGDFKKDCIDFIRILMNFSIVKKEKNICIPVLIVLCHVAVVYSNCSTVDNEPDRLTRCDGI